MPPTHMHIEESDQRTVGLTRLVRTFQGYFRPYTGRILLAVVLALAAVGCDLLLPQLLKTAIDRHLTSTVRRVVYPALPRELPAGVIPGPGTSAFVTDGVLSQLAPQVHIDPQTYYVADASIDHLAVAARHPAVFIRAGDHLFVANRDLYALPAGDLLRLRDADLRGLVRLSILFLLVLGAAFVLQTSQIYLVEWTSQHVMHDIRRTVFDHIQQRPLSFFTRTPTGRLVTRATNDVQNMHEMFNALFANIFKDVCVIAGILGVLAWVSWKLTMISFSPLPLLCGGAVLFSLISRRAFREVRIKIAALNARAQESISGSQIIKAFNCQHATCTAFARTNQEAYRANMRQTTVFAVFNPLVDTVRLAGMALVIWYGGTSVLAGTMTLGTVVLFLYYIRMFFRPIQDLAEKYNIIHSACASMERIHLLLADRCGVPRAAMPQAPPPGPPRITFDRVSFAYKRDEPVLHNVSFTVEPGETVAIVGLTGAGKSTIIALLERLYDVDDGRVLVDGIDVRGLDLHTHRRRMGLVLQDVFLFAGTIRSNVDLRGMATDAQIRAALEIANAHHFVDGLDGGLDAPVGESGAEMSTGQRQLLCCARAVLNQPDLLILDEATSSIDPVTEQLFQQALTTMQRNRTCLVIAHRLDTIRQADRILVLHHGRLEQQGTHDELLARDGLYRNLVQLYYEA